MVRLYRTAGTWAVVSLALVIPVVAAAVLTLFPLTDLMPTWDHWGTVALFQAHDAGKPVLPLLLAPYNGHYNVLPRVIFYGVGLATCWDLRVEVLIAFGWALAALAVFLCMLWRTEPRLLILALPCSATVFALLQFANFIGGFGLGQLMATFASLLTLHLLTNPRCGRVGFLVAMVSAGVAFLSHGAAIGLAPAGLVALALISPEIRWRRLLAWGLVGGFGLGLGVLGGRNVELVVLWARLPALTATLVGRVFATEWDISTVRTALTGTVALATLLGVLGWRVRREWPVGRETLVRWGCVALMPLASAVLIAVGRSQAPLDVVMRSHYVTSTYPIGLALLVLIAEPLIRAATGPAGMRRAWSGVAVLACVAVPVGVQVSMAWDAIPRLQTSRQIVERNVRRLVIGTATDEDIAQALHPVIRQVRSGTDFLRARRLAWFAHAREARKPFGALETISSRRVRPTVRLRQGSPWVLEGWAHPPLLRHGATTEVAVFIDGKLSVRGVPDRPRPDQEAYYASREFLASGFVLSAPDGPRRAPGRYRIDVVVLSGKSKVRIRTFDLIVVPG
jgi:hypothetical protein